MLKKIMFLPLFVLFVLPLVAQDRASDSTYIFRFVRGKAMFLVPYRDNAPTLNRLINRLHCCRARLDSSYYYVSVTGYISRGTDEEGTGCIGYLRNSQVKSQLIIRARLTERMFVTDKVITGTTPDGLTDVVVVTFPASVTKVEQIAGTKAAEKVRIWLKKTQTPVAGAQITVPQTPEPQPAGHGEVPPPAAQNDAAPPVTSTGPPTVPAEKPQPAAIRQIRNTFAIRANLLRWATLTPDLGVEWRIDRRWSILAGGTWTSWSWDDRNRRYALWEISPEVRYIIGKEGCGYVGVLYKAGQFNYKPGDTGKQGNLMGGGITGGYLLRLNNAFAMDFSLGIGYLHADYDKYVVTDGIKVRRGSDSKNWWGPVSAGVILVWQVF